MKDNRNEMIPAQFVDWTWDLTGYVAKVPFYNADDLTMREVQNVFQLDPEPPQMELNDYICEAVRKRDLSYFSFFLHHFEKRLNGVISRFLTRNGYDRYDPARFLDYKLEVLQMLLYCLPKFDPEQETEFSSPTGIMTAYFTFIRETGYCPIFPIAMIWSVWEMGTMQSSGMVSYKRILLFGQHPQQALPTLFLFRLPGIPRSGVCSLIPVWNILPSHGM